MKNFLRPVLLSLAAAIIATVSHAQVSLLVSQSTGEFNYGYGFSRWSTFTTRLNDAVAATSGTVTTVSDVTNAGLLASSTALLLDQRWIGGSLSPTELANLAAFIASGRRVLLIGENDQWTSWDNQILGLVGDTFATWSSDTATPVGINPLIAGVGPIALPYAGVSTGLTGTALFDLNFSRLYGSNVLTLLDVNVFENTDLGTPSNSQYADNVISWLTAPVAAVPEPSTYGMLGAVALLGVITVRRFRRK